MDPAIASTSIEFRTPDRSVLSNQAFWPAVDAPFLVGSPIGDWDYPTCRDFIRDAVLSDAPPSPELVAANARLVLWEAEHGIGTVASYPYTVSFPLTDVCNARCAFCAYIPERVIGRNTGIHEFKQLDWLKFVNTLNLNCGLGEPLMHPDFAEIVNFMRRAAPRLRMTLITNGSKLNRDAVDAIVGFFSDLNVSMNATRKATYEQTMRIPWGPTIAGLKLLRRRKAQTGAMRPNVVLSFVMHRKNLDEIVEAPALARDLGADEIMLANMTLIDARWADRYGRLMTEADVIDVDYDHAFDVLRQFKEECVRQGVRIKGAVPLVDDGEDDFSAALSEIDPIEREDRLRRAFQQRRYRRGYPARTGGRSASPGLNEPPSGFGETSIDFVRQVAAGFDPTCIDPWRTLRIGIRNDISPCSRYAGGLKPFDWRYATARTFHDPAGSWNAPPLQSMRAAMNKPPDEMPYCSGCRNADKHAPNLTDQFRVWKRETLYRLDRTFESGFRGDIRHGADVAHITYGDIGEAEGARAARPVIAQDVAVVRRRVGSYGLRLGGSVAYIGARLAELPFLAEANQSLTVFGAPAPATVEKLAEALGLRNVNAPEQSAWTALKENADAFDGVFIEGGFLSSANRTGILQGVSVALRASGAFALIGYPGPGRALSTTARAMAKVRAAPTLADAIDRVERFRRKGLSLHPAVRLYLDRCAAERLLPNRSVVDRVAALAAGPSHSGPFNFTTPERLRGLLVQFGLRVQDDWSQSPRPTDGFHTGKSSKIAPVSNWEAAIEAIATRSDLAEAAARSPDFLLNDVVATLNARGVRR